MPKIEFILNTNIQKPNIQFGLDSKPQSAKNFIPEEFKRLPSYLNNDLRLNTVKKCVPFLDALTSGYIIPFYQENILTITKRKDGDEDLHITATNSIGQQAGHHINQLPKNYQDSKRPALKFDNKWYVKTPIGYSCLFIHPMNQPKKDYELASGVVDTDTYDKIIQFPYFIRKRFTEQQTQIYIEKDTPMVQVIPFRRESWTSRVGKDNKFGKSDAGFGLVIDMYKKIFWKKKKYE